MARVATIPLITDDAASPELRSEFAIMKQIMGDVPPLARVVANLPPLVHPFMAFAGSLIAENKLPMVLKELAVLRVSEINGCNYCKGWHAPLAEQVGIVGGRRTALTEATPTPGLFDEKELLVLQLADEMTRDVQAQAETVARARQLLGDAATLELMMTIGLYNLINRVARSSGLPLDG